MSETPPTKDALLKVIDDLKQIYETPKLYLDNFFMDLRNEIDKQVNTNLINLEEEKDKIELNEIWKEMISKIESFEKECNQNSINDFQKISNLNIFEFDLKQDKVNDLNEIREQIYTIEYQMMKQLFQNKTIAFIQIGSQ